MLTVNNFVKLPPGDYKVINAKPVPDKRFILLESKEYGGAPYYLVDLSHEPAVGYFSGEGDEDEKGEILLFSDYLKKFEITVGDMINVRSNSSAYRERDIVIWAGTDGSNKRKFFASLIYAPQIKEYLLWDKPQIILVKN